MFHKKENCICCDNKELVEILDLKNQPLANSYHTEHEVLEEFPLKLNLCSKCYHLQLSHIVNPDYLFKNYLYVSGTTKTLLDYFEWFASFTKEYFPNAKSVLEIACNDGSQLNSFKKLGLDTYGIDPAENLHKLSKENHTVVCDYFDKKHYQNKKFDIIVGQNVFAHNENAKKFLDDCYELMTDDSFLFIQTSQADMVQNNQFDTIYHEHISFFNINSFNELVKRTKLNLVDVIKTPIHGISYLFVISKQNLKPNLIKNLIDLEKSYGLLNLETYNTYSKNVNNIVSEFIKNIEHYRNSGYKIIGYGAAAKGNTFLNFANIKLDSIIDDNKLKQGLYTPGTNIKITSIDILNSFHETDKILFVPLAWNFFNEIRTRILKVRQNKNDLYLRYFPNVNVIS
jgi:2-polyprenyl-3-methyl-5-hydroxy-6-metoxy-1,4-benzoquinol methylase